MHMYIRKHIYKITKHLLASVPQLYYTCTKVRNVFILAVLLTSHVLVPSAVHVRVSVRSTTSQSTRESQCRPRQVIINYVVFSTPLLRRPSQAQISSSASYSQMPSAYFPPFNVRNIISYPYETTGKFRVLSIVIFIFLDNKVRDKIFRTARQQTVPELNLLLIYSCT